MSQAGKVIGYSYDIPGFAKSLVLEEAGVLSRLRFGACLRFGGKVVVELTNEAAAKALKKTKDDLVHIEDLRNCVIVVAFAKLGKIADIQINDFVETV